MSNEEELKHSFLETWPLERVQNMSLEDYTNLNKDDSFCYWLEARTVDLGSIWGMSSFKFGVFKRNETEKEYNASTFSTDGEYGWLSKHGDSAEKAFQNVKQLIVEVIQHAQNDSLDAIDDVDLTNVVKWKIAFLYSDFNVINIFSLDMLNTIAELRGMEDADNQPTSFIHRFLSKQKPREESFFDYTHDLWQLYKQTQNENTMDIEVFDTSTSGLNTILFGPPGTGKTFQTVDYALSIIDSEFYEKHQDHRQKLVERFRELLITDWDNPQQGRIAATTFHQSFTYEDFIEGIKPELTSSSKQNEGDSNEELLTEEEKGQKDQIRYTIEPGIFKRISERARQNSGGTVEETKGKLKWDWEQFNKAEFYKLSLGDINIPEDEDIYDYCIQHDKIAIGFIGDKNLSGKEEREIRNLSQNNPDIDKHYCRSMASFIHNLKKGYYVVIPNGNHKFRAIGRVTGDYEYNPDSPIRYNHFRDIEWLVTDLDLPVDLIYNKNFMQQTIYQLRKVDVKPEFFIKSKASKTEGKSYVLIIDEINRGNIAQIFGELITLIEEDKREEQQEELEVSLPYSKKPFSVPSNLYILGTMNTADRSVEALDTALRRRFKFKEVAPRPHIIAEEGKLKEQNGVVQVGDLEIPLPDLLITINKRIEKILDKDHLIGHSYFMGVEDAAGLQHIFHQNIIPLLEEYFYGDKGKIQLVLGKGFVKRVDSQLSDGLFPPTDYEDQGLFADRIIWRIRNEWRDSATEFADALRQFNIQNSRV